MPSFADLQDVAVDHLRADVAALVGQMSQPGRDVDFGYRRRKTLQRGDAFDGPLADDFEQLLLAGDGPVAGGEDFGLVFLQFVGDVPLGVLERLFADIIRRSSRRPGCIRLSAS